MMPCFTLTCCDCRSAVVRQTSPDDCDGEGYAEFSSSWLMQHKMDVSVNGSSSLLVMDGVC